jgi:hypothetical protein
MEARKILARCLVVGAVLGFAALACQGPEPYYRESDTGLAGSTPLGTAGSIISGTGGDTGAAGSTGVAGSLSGVAGSTGAAGAAAGSTGAAGSGVAGSSSGVAGAGEGGSTGAAGAGPAGSTGAAGAATGRGGSTGAAGAATGRGGAAGMARGGSTGTAGMGHGGSTGAAGSVAPPPPIQVVAQCQSMASTNTITVHFKILNLANTSIPFSTITARYFYTLEDPAMTVPTVEFDYLQSLTKTQITVTATATYVEFGFTSAAGALQAFDNISGTGEIQARIHPPNYSPTNWDTNQVNDSSYKACTGTTYDPRPGFIAYVGGRQSWPAPTTP